MTKSIEDYPELKAKFDETLVLDAFHHEFSVLCNPIKVRKLLLEMKATIEAQQERIIELESQPKFLWVVSYMKNTMGCFYTKQEALDYREQFGGVYSIERYEITSAVTRFHESFY